MERPNAIWIKILTWGLLWSAIIATSLFWNQHLVRKHITFHAHQEAATVINKDHAFRRWATMHGGVYVHPTETTPPNPWLKVPKRDVLTTDGDALTLMNPAYMTRQIMGMFGDLYGIKGHITSLHLKNPHNAPDDWERQALHRFEHGAPSVGEMSTLAGAPVYRLIQPMKMEEGCLKCHADTAIPVGGIRGGISTIVPLTVHFQEAAINIRSLRLWHGAIWLLGILGITITGVHTQRRQQREQQTEKKLRDQEALYASLTTAAPIGIFHADREGKCTYVNQCWLQLTGLTLEQALGDGWQMAMHPDDRQHFFDAWHELATIHRPFHLEYRYKKHDGTIVWVESRAAEIFDDVGAVSGYVRVVNDITQRKETAAALTETTLFLNESQSIARVGGWKSNPSNDSLYWTDQVYRMMEHPAGEPISHTSCFRYFDPRDLPTVQQALERAYQDGTPFQLTCRMISGTGRSFWIDFRCIGGMDSADGPCIGGIMQDITEYKLAEELLTIAKETAEATSRAKTELLAVISHELRTPLNGVVGGVQLLEMTDLSEDQEEYVQMIKQSSASELALVNDLLDLAGLEAFGMTIAAEPFNLRESIASAVQLHRTALSMQGLSFDMDLPDSLEQLVIGDGRRVSQIVGNLLGNAVKFTPQGEVRLAAELQALTDGRLLLNVQVSDTGIGIDHEHLEQIFEPFVQADMSHTRRFGGSGLGLAICRRLAERMGGRIRVDSRPGQGSAFTLELPLMAAGDGTAASIPLEVPETPVWHGPPLTVLIAEDNQINLKAAAGLVDKLGLKVVSAEDGKQALAHWMGGSIDLILMDVQMPVMDGREALGYIRQRERETGRHTPVIALTARAMAGDREQLLSEGFDGYVAKPFDLVKLLEELTRVMQR